MAFHNKVYQALQLKGLYNVLANSVLEWIAFKGVCHQTLVGHQSVRCIIELKNGNLASASDDETIKIWKNGTCIQTLKGHTDVVMSLIELKNGHLASCGWDKTIKLWKDGVCIQTLKGHNGCVRSVIELKNGNLASASNDKSIKIWN